jgi:hypothetical protein
LIKRSWIGRLVHFPFNSNRSKESFATIHLLFGGYQESKGLMKTLLAVVHQLHSRSSELQLRPFYLKQDSWVFHYLIDWFAGSANASCADTIGVKDRRANS